MAAFQANLFTATALPGTNRLTSGERSQCKQSLAWRVCRFRIATNTGILYKRNDAGVTGSQGFVTSIISYRNGSIFMRNLFIIAVLLLVAFMAGWFTVNRNGDRTTIEINRTEIRQDTREVIDRGRELLQQHQHEHDGMHSLRDAAAELLNQGTAAPQAGNWGSEAGQAGYQNFIPEQRIGAQPNSVQPWQQVAPTSNW